MPIFNVQIPLSDTTPVLLVHVGAPARAYFSWNQNASGLTNLGVVFGGPGLTPSNGFRVGSSSPFEPFVVDVPANEYLYAMKNVGDPINLTMMVIY